MLVFQQLLNLKTKPLDSAIDDWVAMVKKLKELAKEAGDMSTYAQGTAWKGENASVTKPFVTRTRGRVHRCGDPGREHRQHPQGHLR
ncbi:hypothetical protein ACVWZD_003701 [Streptomyces sp. TE3672]